MARESVTLGFTAEYPDVQIHEYPDGALQARVAWAKGSVSAIISWVPYGVKPISADVTFQRDGNSHMQAHMLGVLPVNCALNKSNNVFTVTVP